MTSFSENNIMAEDEEVIFEGHELDKYLKKVGFSNFDAEKPMGAVPSSPDDTERLCAHSNYLNATSSYVNSAFNVLRNPWISRVKPADHVMLYKLIKTILDCGLLFEDDVQFVNNVLPNSNQDNQVVSKRSWKNATISIIATVPSMCLDLWQETAIPLAGFVLVDVLWIWKKNKQYQHHSEHQRKLLDSMRELYLVFSKAIKLLQENELILRGFTLARTGSTVSRLELSDLPCMIRKWDSSPGLRIAVMKALLDALYILSRATQTLISFCPLFGQLDNSSHYVSFLDFETFGGLQNTEDSDVKLSHLKRLHHMFLLLQSEFLRRLALCYCPVLWKHDSFKQVSQVMKVICNVTEQCSKLCSNLTREYNVFYSYGISDKIQQRQLKPSIHKLESLESTDTCIAVRSASLHLRALLLNTRALEEKLETRGGNEEENFNDIISHLSDIIRELDVCRSCCEEGILQVRKLKSPSEDTPKPIEQALENIVVSDVPVKQIRVGYTDLDPQVEDEIFEAVITETGSGSSHLYDEMSNVEYMQHEIAKQLSKNMMQELKSVLAVKAEKWKEREANALQAKLSPDSGNAVKVPVNSDRHVVYDSKEDLSSFSNSHIECSIEYHDSLEGKTKLSSSCLSIDQRGSPLHRLLQEHRTESCGSLERCADSPISNASSSSRATLSRSPKHVYASETFRPLKNDLQFSVGLHLSNDALAKFQARHIEASDTFSGVGEKSSSEESLES